MEIRPMMYEMAARALATHEEAENDIELQKELCRRYGVIFEEMTDDELLYLYSLANEFMGE